MFHHDSSEHKKRAGRKTPAVMVGNGNGNTPKMFPAVIHIQHHHYNRTPKWKKFAMFGLFLWCVGKWLHIHENVVREGCCGLSFDCSCDEEDLTHELGEDCDCGEDCICG